MIVVVLLVQSLEEASVSLLGSIGTRVVIILGEGDDSNSCSSGLLDSDGSMLAD